MDQPERVEELEVLERLRPRPVVGGDDEEDGVDLAGTDEHVADEPVVAGHVHEVEHVAIGKRQVRITDLDRHPPPALLGKAVGIDPGQRVEQGRLAVIDVTRRPDDHGHRPVPAPPIAAPIARTSSSSAAGSTVRRSRTALPPSIRPRTAGAPAAQGVQQPVRGCGRPPLQRETEGRQRPSGQ